MYIFILIIFFSLTSFSDNLDDSSSLPELSFDDLLDSSPIKKNGKSNVVDEDSLDYEEYEEHKTSKDDSLNTPCPKKTRMIPKTLNNSYITTKAVPIRTNTMMKTGVVNSMTTYTKSNSGSISGSVGGSMGANTAPAPPVLLNSKNILPKMATQIPNNSIKLTPKNVSSTTGGNIGGGLTATGSSSGAGVTMTTKTAVRTSTGQLIYIQKTPVSAAATSAIKTTNTTVNVKQPTSTTTAVSSGSKPMTIQVMRNPDGSFVPLKSSAATAVSGGANGKTTLTLSPNTSVSGKKILTSTGGQVVIRSANASAAITNPGSTIKTVVQKTTGGSNDSVSKTKTIVVQQPSNNSGGGGGGVGDSVAKTKTYLVQNNNGKQILVSNPNLVKLSPKPQMVSAAVSCGEISATTSTASLVSGGQQQHQQLQAIQMPGKSGVQYVRVMPASKTQGTAAKPLTVTTTTGGVVSAGNTTTTVRIVTSTAGATTSTASHTPATSSNPVKILNNLPQKFTVVQKGGGAKVVVTQKKDANGVEFTPIASKVQKTLVTMPCLRSIKEENKKTQSSPNIAATAAVTNQQTLLVRKHKISEINSELKRITTTNTDGLEDSGVSDVKKPANSNRVVVISSNAPTILNTSIQQPGRVTTFSNTSNAASGGGSIQVQATRVTAASVASTSSSSSTSTTTTVASGNKLYTILKPSSSTGQQNNTKLYSVLKTTNVPTVPTNSQTTFTTPHAITSSSTSSSSSSVPNKPLLNKQSLMQQQQKIFQLKQLQKTKLSQAASNTTTSTAPSNTTTVVIKSSSTLCPIKIKEEPIEFYDNTTNKPLSNTSASSQSSFNAAASTSASASQSMSVVDMQDDPNKLDLVGGVRRKHCNCSKSQCLKLYCDCFANGEFCQDCTCKDCFNNLENEDERQRAIRSCLERNPSAFK